VPGKFIGPGRLRLLASTPTFLPVRLWVAMNSGCLSDAFVSSNPLNLEACPRKDSSD
jgi:hypothetical protein